MTFFVLHLKKISSIIMKKLLSSIAIIAFAITSFSQEKLELHYKLKVTPTSKEYKKVARQLNGGTMDFYITKEAFRMDVGFKKQANTTMVIDMNLDSMILIISGDETGNLAFAGTFDEVKERNKNKEKKEKINEERIVGSEKIKGFDCVKTILKEDGKTSIIWSTSSIKNPNETKGVVEGSNSIPIQFSVEEDGMILLYTLKKHDYSFDNEIFDLSIPAGFKVNRLSNL